MRITLGLGRLLADGEITPAEDDELSRLAARDTTAFAFNILFGFGVIAVGGAALALLWVAPSLAADLSAWRRN